MKKIFFSALLGLLAFSGFAQNANSFYYEKIATPDKTISFTFGVYHGSMEYVTKNDGSGYSKMVIAVINDAKADDFYWSDYKVYILLKSGDLLYNYTTEAKTDNFACKYTVPAGETHKQSACFAKKFVAGDIQKIWLSFSDTQFFKLIYDENEK